MSGRIGLGEQAGRDRQGMTRMQRTVEQPSVSDRAVYLALDWALLGRLVRARTMREIEKAATMSGELPSSEYHQAAGSRLLVTSRPVPQGDQT